MQAAEGRPAARSHRAHEEMSVGQMVRENRPHRLVRDLSKVLVATLASAGFFVTNSDAWGRCIATILVDGPARHGEPSQACSFFGSWTNRS